MADLSNNNMSYTWAFIQGVQPGTSDELSLRFQMQFLSDVYKAMQTRLDGYRQSAGAIFLAVIASALTFDSVFVRYVVDKPKDLPLSTPPLSTLPLSLLVVLSGCIVLGVCISGFMIIKSIGKYFAEMSSIIYKIDVANQVFKKNAWLIGETLYPPEFQTTRNVSMSKNGNILYGWIDPAILRFELITGVIGVLHIVFYGFILWRVATAI